MRHARNGGYRLELTVSDNNNLTTTSGDQHHSETWQYFFLDSALKPGRFAFSVTDLDIPVKGVPVTITRSYDSYDTNAWDFGRSWQLSVGGGQLLQSGVLGKGWFPDGQQC